MAFLYFIITPRQLYSSIDYLRWYNNIVKFKLPVQQAFHKLQISVLSTNEIEMLMVNREFFVIHFNTVRLDDEKKGNKLV